MSDDMSDDRLYLNDILDCIVRIQDYTAGGYDAFMQNSMIQDAVFRNLSK
jgi:uncharacterized protein with HEPN domain